jgi:hypothetical protein
MLIFFKSGNLKKGLYVGLPDGGRDEYVNLTQTNMYLFSRFKYIQREKLVLHKGQLLYFILFYFQFHRLVRI